MRTVASFKDLKKLAKNESLDLPSCKLAVLGDFATQHFVTCLKGCARMSNFNLDIFEADYDQIEMQIVDPASELYGYGAEYVLIAQCAEKLFQAFLQTPESDRVHFAENKADEISGRWSVLASRMNTSIVQLTFVYENDRTFGSYALVEPSSFAFQLQKLNFLLSEAASKNKQVFLVDTNAVKGKFRCDEFCDNKMLYIAKMPFSLVALPAIASEVVGVINALRGKFAKCVVLDLDNTLWGGIIGDDGLEGIQIGEYGDGPAFVAFQGWLKELRRRGILLAVCSKNNEDAAKEPFEKHADMVLALDDFVMFVANWDDKASNIKAMREALNIGFDSMVFVDDNPFERHQVKTMIPDIIVPDMPEDPADYLSHLQRLNLFETASYSSADAARTEQYQVATQRSAMLVAYDSYEEYLEALEMRAVAAPFDNFHYPRIAQLTQRSNQFNLRTVRYTEDQIEKVANSLQHITRYYTLEDKFGDYGLISVVVMDKRDGDALFISEWLMSCRVLKRTMEEFIVNDLVEVARESGAKTLIGEYIATPKNSMVADIYTRMGFNKGDDAFYLDVETYLAKGTSVRRKVVAE